MAKALSPARAYEVLVDDDGRQATVVVPDDQLSLAIGREGQNARLAARLTGWRIDIRSRPSSPPRSQDSGPEQEETSGRCRGDPGQRPALPQRIAAQGRATAAVKSQALRHQPTDCRRARARGRAAAGR